MRNPPSTQSYGPYSVIIQYGNFPSLVCPSLYSSVTTLGALTVSVSPNNRVISSTSSRTLVYTLKTPIVSTTYILL